MRRPPEFISPPPPLPAITKSCTIGKYFPDNKHLLAAVYQQPDGGVQLLHTQTRTVNLISCLNTYNEDEDDDDDDATVFWAISVGEMAAE